MMSEFGYGFKQLFKESADKKRVVFPDTHVETVFLISTRTALDSQLESDAITKFADHSRHSSQSLNFDSARELARKAPSAT